MQADSWKEILNEDKILFSFGKEQKVMSRSIVMHPDLELMFVADAYNEAIQVYTQSGDHVTTHEPSRANGEFLFLWGMAYKCDTLYASDISQNRIFSFNDFTTFAHDRWRNCEIMSLASPRGLSCDEDSNVYVADKNKNRICVFDYELKPIGVLAKIMRPRDLQVVGEELAVLSEGEPFLVVCTLRGEILRTLDKLIKYCIEPWFFFIDEDWNIFISDYDLYCCSVFKKTGEFGKRLFKSQKQVSVFGISLTAEKKIVISSSNKESPFHIFPEVF